MIDAYVRFSSALNERLGRIGSWMFIPVTFIIVFEVTMRYVFDNPTVWSWDVVFHFQTLLIITGGGYLIIYAGHVRVDVFYAKFSRRGQALIDVVLFPLFVLSYGALLWLGLKEVEHAFRIQEFLPSTFEVRLWPVKGLMVVGVTLLMLQGIGKFTTDLRGLIGGGYAKAVTTSIFSVDTEKKAAVEVKEEMLGVPGAEEKKE